MAAEWQTRTALLMGDEALERLSCSTVAVVGVGGVGAYAAEMLARAGVGHLILLDCDVVSPSDKNRQLLVPKLALIEYCVKSGIPHVSSMGAGAKYDATKVRLVDLSKSYNCPPSSAACAPRRQLISSGKITNFAHFLD